MSELPEFENDETQASLYGEIVAGYHRKGPRGSVIFCVSTDDLDEGKGDPYVALGLAKSLIDEGWGVALWPIRRWHEVPDPVPTVAIVMIESFIPGLLPASTATIAWIRNWTESWASLPYLEEFDGIWTSSSLSGAVLQENYSGEVAVVPIAVDNELFVDDGDAPRSMPVITTANFWGAPRHIQTALTHLARSTPVTWFGANRAHLVRSSSIRHADQVSFFTLPSVYRQSSIVVDDLIDAARAYGNQNSRLFEAIASGAVPITNGELGLEALGLEEVPTYEDDESLSSAAQALLADEGARLKLAARLRKVVLERHTYRVRAAAVQPLLDTAIARAGGRGERGPLLRWATLERRRLQESETVRDQQLAAYHQLTLSMGRLEREAAELRAHNAYLRDELTAMRLSRIVRLARKISHALQRVRKRAGARRNREVVKEQ